MAVAPTGRLGATALPFDQEQSPEITRHWYQFQSQVKIADIDVPSWKIRNIKLCS
jgi:hypothetical protein